MLKGELNNMQSQINRGSSHQLSMINIELSKTNKKLDGLIDLLTDASKALESLKKKSNEKANEK